MNKFFKLYGKVHKEKLKVLELSKKKYLKKQFYNYISFKFEINIDPKMFDI